MAAELKPEDEQALEFWLKYYDEWGRPPVIEDVGRAIGVAPPNNATRNLKRLAAAGKLAEVVAPNGRRFYRLPGDDRRGFSLPVPGPVAAGKPIPVVGADSERFVFNDHFGDDGVFMLKVRGVSMVEAGILNGDYAVLRPAEAAEDGDTVVAEIDGEVTLKVFQKRRDVVTLKPCNKDMEPIRLNASSENRIVGVLLGVVRSGAKKGRRK